LILQTNQSVANLTGRVFTVERSNYPVGCMTRREQ
jgi:hypothetical protein